MNFDANLHMHDTKKFKRLTNETKIALKSTPEKILINEIEQN